MKDPEIIIKMSPTMLKDLINRCEENGTTQMLKQLDYLALLKKIKSEIHQMHYLKQYTDNAKEEILKAQ